MLMFSSSVSALHSSGTGPKNEFPCRLRIRSSVRFPTALGSSPLSTFHAVTRISPRFNWSTRDPSAAKYGANG